MTPLHHPSLGTLLRQVRQVAFLSFYPEGRVIFRSELRMVGHLSDSVTAAKSLQLDSLAGACGFAGGIQDLHRS